MATSFHACFAAFLWFLTLLASGNAQNTSFLRTINVQGTGTASAPPDLATVNTGVTTTAKTAETALADNNKKFQQVLNVLKQKGIDEKDVQTTFFDVFPQFARGQGGNRGEITGYRVSNEVSVKVRDLDILGEILDALVTAGSNNISGVNFSLDDAKLPTAEARKMAIADAKDRAELYAMAADVRVGKVLSISETVIQQPRPDREFALSSAAADSAVPIASGELDIQVQVFMLFELLD